MIVSIHQPEHIPYYGFFSKILKSDLFIILDDVQYEKNNWQNRNRILNCNGAQYITVPVKYRYGMKLNEVEIDRKQWVSRARSKNLKSISQAYSKHPYFNDFFEQFSAVYTKEHLTIAGMNIEMIILILEYLGINTQIKMASDFNIVGEKNERLVNLCNEVGATFYLSGTGAKGYIDENMFGSIKVLYNENDIMYPQKNGSFIPYLSIIDGIFNQGRGFIKYLYGSN